MSKTEVKVTKEEIELMFKQVSKFNVIEYRADLERRKNNGQIG